MVACLSGHRSERHCLSIRAEDDDVLRMGYVLVEASPQEATTWRDADFFKGALPDLTFPKDRAWLFSTFGTTSGPGSRV